MSRILPGNIEHLLHKSSPIVSFYSVIAKFPAQKIETEIDKLNSTMPASDKDIYEMTISPVVNVCRKYRHGVRGKFGPVTLDTE